MLIPEQTPGYSSEYDDHADNHSKDFFTKQQNTTYHFNNTCYSRYTESKPDKKPKTNTVSDLRYSWLPTQQWNRPNWKVQKPATIRSPHGLNMDFCIIRLLRKYNVCEKEWLTQYINNLNDNEQ